MNKIESFQVDHTVLDPGIYVSRVDGDITTYDLRTRKPNTGQLVDNGTIHSLEHMFATFIRNSSIKDQVIYFGPMGCQTGFYLLVRDANQDVILNVTKEVLRNIIDYQGEIFGKSEIECGNCANLDLELAKKEAALYLKILESNVQTFVYNKGDIQL